MSGEIIEAEVEHYQNKNRQLSVPAGHRGFMAIDRKMLDDYAAKRLEFRHWLLSLMKQGEHYGTPPGCARQSSDQWKSRPSLYHAGAQLIADVMGWRPAYESDALTWEMLGKPKETFIRKCTLWHKDKETSVDSVVGEGAGARVNGEKKMNLNASLKMADKSAMVAAVINTANIADLFTQDLDDIEQQQAEQPKPRDNAPIAQPRSERLKTEDVKKLGGLLRDYLGSHGADNSDAAVSEWLVRNGFFKTAEESTKLSNWKPDIYASLKEKLEQLTNGN